MALPPIFIAFLGDYTGLKESADGVKEELAEVDAEGGASLESLGAVGKGVMLGMGAAMIGAAYESVKLAVSFQTAMTQISTQAGVPKAQLQSLGNGVLELAGQVGFSPDSLAEALYHIESSFASIGITGSQALNILKIAAEGAAVGHADLVDVQNALDAAIASGIPGVQNYAQAMGALNAIVGSGDMQMQDLADALGTGVLAVVKGYGLTLNDVGAALATFGDNNIRGAVAATDLRMAVQAMAVPASTASVLLKKMGMDSSTLAKDMQTGGMSKALTDLNTRLKKVGITGNQVGSAMVTLFGKKAGSGLDVLLGQYDRVMSKYPELEKGASGFNSAVAQNNDTIAQQINMLKASFEAMGTALGEKLLPWVTKVFGELAKGVSWLAAHPSTFYAIASAIGAVTVSLGAISVVLAIVNAELLANPAVWIAVAIMALGAAVFYAWTHFKSFRDAVKDVGNALMTAWKWFDQTVVKSKALGDAVRAVVNGIAAVWRVQFNMIGQLIRTFENGPLKSIETTFGKVAQFWHQYGGEIEKDTDEVWKSVAAYIRAALTVALAAIKFMLNIASSMWTGVWDMLRDGTKMTWDMLANIFRTAVDFILDIVKTFLDLLHGHWHAAFDDALSVFSNLFGNLGHMFSTFASDGLKLLYDAGVNVIKGLISGIKAGFGLITSTMKAAGHLITSAFHSIMGIFSPSRVMYQSGSYIIAGLHNALLDGLPLLGSAAGKLGSAIMTGFGQPRLGIGGVGTSVGPQLGMGGINATATGGTAVNVQMNVQGSIRSDKDIRNMIQTEFLQLGGRNIATWAPARI